MPTINNCSEIALKNEEDEDTNIMSALRIIEETIGKTKNERGFYYLKILKLMNYKDITEFYFCEICNKSFIFYVSGKDLLELDTISYSCDCDKIEHNKIKISSLDMNEYKSEISYIEDELLCKNIRDNKLCKNKFSYFHIKSNENICQTCYEGDNTKELNRFDSISIFSNLNYLINFIIDEKNISNINNEKIDSKTKEKKLENYAKLKHLIITTIVNYILYPNYNLYVTQKNLFEAFIEYTENINIQNDCDYYKKQIEINRNKKKLVNLNPKLNNYVIKVDVRQLKFYEKSIEKYIL